MENVIEFGVELPVEPDEGKLTDCIADKKKNRKIVDITLREPVSPPSHVKETEPEYTENRFITNM